MSRIFQESSMPERRKSIWLWPNLLSLDAPVVALVWLFMFKVTWQMGYLPWQAYLTLGLAVWVVYVYDKLLDVKILEAGDKHLVARHDFHSRHQTWLAISAAVAFLICVFFAFFSFPRNIVPFSLPVLLAVGLFFAAVIYGSQEQAIPFSRNMLAGFSFSYGTAMTAKLFIPESALFQLLFSSEMMAFAGLCILNICLIHYWEHLDIVGEKNPDVEESAILIPMVVVAGLCLIFAVADQTQSSRPFYYSVLMATGLLYTLNRNRGRLSLEVLRVLADVAMIAPLPVFLALSAGK
jgi:hypothetical protein